jgi:uncharacterized protein
MALTMYQAAFPPTGRTIKALGHILDKAAAHCETRKIDPRTLLSYRLAPDMYDLTRQVQAVSDQAKGMAARLGGVAIPSFPDVETSFSELHERLGRTSEFLKSISEAQVEGSEDREVVLKIGPNEMKFSGRDYLFGFFMPNFFFHTTAAYTIIRHAGVELGKRDFLSGR